MVEFKVKTRATGSTASMAQHGPASLVTETGGTLDVVTSVSDPGFNPLDLLYSSLSACLVLSVKGAVVKLHLLEKFSGVRVHVTGQKAPEGPSRVAEISADIQIGGDLSEEERHQIVALAKELCTVSNTLVQTPTFTVTTQPM
ncbi:putative OsmC-like protein [Neorhizobium galegae]|uniref:OsmC family protein n=1 Tax=Neorhizobium galegae TaxID=399 RepID=UPI001AEB846D|nr:OsmC family protein [Neorhizobium galegae]MBP2549487.1 putative OsmC-like protein [Neorhizobium galegae]